MAEGGRITGRPSGFTEDFLNAVEDDLQCSICHLPLNKPVLTRCGHRFCKECLGEHFRRQGESAQHCNCPIDRIDLDRAQDVFPDKATERKILSFAIKCPSEGCDWTGELRSKEVHLASCLLKLVHCTNENCHVTMQRRHLEEHVTINCTWRILECDHCSEPHPVCNMQDHFGQCSKFPVTCSNGCGASIRREMIRNHTEYDCPLTIISCPYEKMGCEIKVQRVQVDSHLQSATRLHLDLACVKLTNTEAKLNETEQKLEATRKVVEKLDTRIFIWRINNFTDFWRQAYFSANTDQKPSRESVPFYTDRTESYGYKLKVRIYPEGSVGRFYGSMVVAIVVMKGEYDAILSWPFEKKVKFTLIDQQEDPVERENITHLFIPANDPEAFARPLTGDNKERCGFLLSFEKLHSRRYLVNDTLFLQVEVSSP